MKKNLQIIILILIITLSAGLRLYKISSIPPGLTWDEAALGYNAYSILKTGRDEYGQLFPINLKSFGDYKPALYAYLDIPFIATFGLSEIGVRLPSVFSGIGFVVLCFFLARKIFKNNSIALSVAFFASISPLSIQFSRAAWESNLALFLNTLGFYLFLIGRERRKFLLFSAIAFGLSMLTYQASRFFVPFFSLGLIYVYWKDIKNSKWAFGAFGVLVTFILVFVTTTFLLGQSSRLTTQNFFAYKRADELINQISKEDHLSVNSPAFKILHGEWFAYTRGLVERYLIYFSPKMLFIDGDYSPRHRVPDIGVLYFFSLILIPLGILFLIKNSSKETQLLTFWLLIAPLPGVFSRDLINFVRVLNMGLPIVILEGLGFYYLILKIKKTQFMAIPTVLILVAVMMFNVAFYLDQYFVHAPQKYSQGFLYGYKEALQVFIDKNSPNYNKVVVTDYYGQPYIYYLFYSKYPPELFQKQSRLDQKTPDVGTVRLIDNIEFRHVFWPADRGCKKCLFIATLEELPDQDVKPFPEFTLLKDVNFLDLQPAFRVVETK